MDSAFANDRNLSTDKKQGQYDDIFTGEEYIESDVAVNEEDLTDVQKKWRQSQLVSSENNNNNNNNNLNTCSNDIIPGVSFLLDLYLSGVPERDPSNDLYGSRVNISSRDKDTNLSLPEMPSVSNVQLDFLEDGVCKVSETSFTTAAQTGEWKVSDDGRCIRFGFESLGYTRTVETKGSIQNVYWSNEEEKKVETSTTYSIPAGPVYGDIQIVPPSSSARALTGQRRTLASFTVVGDGILRINQYAGLFGISSKMIPCGKFRATIIRSDSNNNDQE